MTTLAINDLAASKELDSKAMAGVSGGMGYMPKKKDWLRKHFGDVFKDNFSPRINNDNDNVWQDIYQLNDGRTHNSGDYSTVTGSINYNFAANVANT